MEETAQKTERKAKTRPRKESGEGSITESADDDSLVLLDKRRKTLLCFLEPPGSSVTIEEVKKRLWGPWDGLAQDIEAKIKQKEGRAAVLEVKVIFQTEDERRRHRLHINKSGMQKLVDGVEKVGKKKNTLKKKETEVKTSCGGGEENYKTTKKNNTQYAGPNGQPQRRTTFKSGFCAYNCGEFIAESDIPAHEIVCRAFREYGFRREKYEESAERISGRPSAFVAYEKGAVGSKPESPHVCFRYGIGPYIHG